MECCVWVLTFHVLSKKFQKNSKNIIKIYGKKFWDSRNKYFLGKFLEFPEAFYFSFCVLVQMVVLKRYFGISFELGFCCNIKCSFVITNCFLLSISGFVKQLNIVKVDCNHITFLMAFSYFAGGNWRKMVSF